MDGKKRFFCFVKFLKALVILLVGVCCEYYNAFALSADMCNQGGVYEYCAGSHAIHSCKTCPANCYCPARNNAGDVACTAWAGIWCDATNHKVKSNTNANVGNGSYGVYLCPPHYSNSDAGRSSINECYLTTSAKYAVLKAKEGAKRCRAGDRGPGNGRVDYGKTGGAERC